MLTKSGAGGELLKNILNLRSQMESIIAKFDRLKLIRLPRIRPRPSTKQGLTILGHRFLNWFCTLSQLRLRIIWRNFVSELFSKVSKSSGCFSFASIFSDVDSDDEDFEDVPTKEGYELDIPDHLREEHHSASKVPMKLPMRESAKVLKLARCDIDPTSASATITKLKEKLMKEAWYEGRSHLLIVLLCKFYL